MQPVEQRLGRLVVDAPVPVIQRHVVRDRDSVTVGGTVCVAFSGSGIAEKIGH